MAEGKKIILLGASMDCFPICLALFSGFLSIRSPSYDNLALCHKIAVLTFVVQATQDRIIPETSAHCLVEALEYWGSLVTIPTGHQRYLNEDLQKRIIQFIRKLVRKLEFN